MYRLLKPTLALLALVLFAGCTAATVDDPEPAFEPAATTDTPETTADDPPQEDAIVPRGTPMEQTTQMEATAKSDLAQRFDIAADQIETISVEERTWPDKGLGCAARKGLFEPQRTPGYRFVFARGEETFTYHTDQAGNFVLCNEPETPPLGPKK